MPDVSPVSGDGSPPVAALACVAGSDRSRQTPPPAIAHLAIRSVTRRVFGFDIDDSLSPGNSRLPNGGHERACCSFTTVQAYGPGCYESSNIYRMLLNLVDEFGGEAVHLRVVGVGGPVPRLVEVEPADALELPWVGGDSGVVPCHPEDEPQVDVEMGVCSRGRRDGQEERLVVHDLGRYPQLLARFADDGLVGILPVLDVTAGRQPQPRLAV